MDVETLKASGILSVLASHEGRQKLRDISVKVIFFAILCNFIGIKQMLLLN